MGQKRTVLIGEIVRTAMTVHGLDPRSLAAHLGLSLGYTRGILSDADVVLSDKVVKKMLGCMPSITITSELVAAKNAQSREVAKAYRAKQQAAKAEKKKAKNTKKTEQRPSVTVLAAIKAVDQMLAEQVEATPAAPAAQTIAADPHGGGEIPAPLRQAIAALPPEMQTAMIAMFASSKKA